MVGRHAGELAIGDDRRADQLFSLGSLSGETASSPYTLSARLAGRILPPAPIAMVDMNQIGRAGPSI